MKENFEQALHNIDKMTEENTPKWEILRRFHRGEFDEYFPNVEKLLFVIKEQKEKRFIIDELHEKFRAIDNGESVTGFNERKTRTVRDWNTEQERGYLTSRSGKTFPVTIGDLLSDGSWGISYKLEADIPRDIKKRFVVAEAKRCISEILTDQMIWRKKPSINNEKYHNNNPRIQNTLVFSAGSEGHIAEKFVENFFQKLSEDAHLPFKVDLGDFHEDRERATDIMFHLLDDKVKGVDKKDVRVQLTTNSRERDINKKRQQIEKIKKEGNLDVDDFVLVALSFKKYCFDIYEQWKNAGMLPGGPTKLWDMKTKEMVFRGVLKDILPEEKINEMWEKVKMVQ